MPNVTGAFLPFGDHIFKDSSAEMEVDLEDAETIQEEVYDSVGSDLALARAHAAPVLEFLAMPLPFNATRSNSIKLLNYDASRKSIKVTSYNGVTLLSKHDISNMFTPGSNPQTTITAPIPAYYIPTNGVFLELNTSEPIWVTNFNSSTPDVVFFAIEKYAQ